MAIFIGLAAAAFDVSLLLSREVRGASYPVNRWGTQCSNATLTSSPCSCYGGAARRNTLTAEAGVVTIDTGSHFSGSGLFFPIFQGNASAEMFAAGGFSGWSLSYHDFRAFGVCSFGGCSSVSDDVG